MTAGKKKLGTRMHGEDSWERTTERQTAGREKPGHNIQDRTTREDSSDSTSKTRQRGQEGQEGQNLTI
jgi:hypothetical protein